jgi:hypothetical protein
MPVAAARAASAPQRIERLLERIRSAQTRVKYAAAKTLRQISAEQPETVYPYFDELMRMFESEKTFLRWGATLTLGNLAAVDREGRFEKVLQRFLAPISGHEMIGAANAIVAASQIAAAKPRLAARIGNEVLKVEQAVFKTPECRNVAIGHAIRAFDRFAGVLPDRAKVVAFVSRQLDNPRQATRRKAERFLKKWR